MCLISHSSLRSHTRACITVVEVVQGPKPRGRAPEFRNHGAGTEKNYAWVRIRGMPVRGSMGRRCTPSAFSTG